jgi:sirohydrochlorin cobaltochelatase
MEGESSERRATAQHGLKFDVGRSALDVGRFSFLNPMVSRSTSALLIVGHGSTVNPDSSAPTLLHAAEIRRRGIFADVACCFWKEEPSLRDALFFFQDPAISGVCVVPNFISEGYFTRTVIPRELELTGPETRRRSGQVWRYCQPVGNHERMTDLLLQRAHEVAPEIPEAETSLLIVGHGTGLNDNSAVAAKHQVEIIRALNRYAAVLNVYMEEPPLVSDWLKLTETRNVVVVPFFVSDGLHSYEDIPAMLGTHSKGLDAASGNPHELHGRSLFYSSAIGTDPMLADVIIEQAASFDPQRPAVESAS